MIAGAREQTRSSSSLGLGGKETLVHQSPMAVARQDGDACHRCVECLDLGRCADRRIQSREADTGQ